jgi:hypothetical protein
MIACGVVACAPGSLGYTEPATDLSRQLEVREPFDFGLTVELSVARLEGAALGDAGGFELRDGGDAVFFVRDREIAARPAFEWISISRVSGRYAHFIAFRDAATGSLNSPLLMTAAGCQPHSP